MISSTLPGVGLCALLLCGLPSIYQAIPSDAEREECADNAHLLVERLRRSYTGHLLKNVLQNFCNGETEKFVHLHHFSDVATCRRMSDKLVDAFSKSVKQKSSMEPYFDWCREVEEVSGSVEPAARVRGPNIVTKSVVAAPQQVDRADRPVAHTRRQASEPIEDQFENVLRSFKSKISPAVTVSQEALAKSATTMFAKSDAANAEAPNFAAHVQRQQDQQKDVQTSESNHFPSEEAAEVAKPEPPAIVHEAQQTVAVGRSVQVSESTEGVNEQQEKLTKGSPKEDSQPVVDMKDGLPALHPKEQSKFERSSRYDVSGPSHSEANLKPMEVVIKPSEGEAPCPSYAVTLSTVGHQPLQSFGERVPCKLDGFGNQLHLESQLPHLAEDGTPLEKVEEKTRLEHGMDRMSKLMTAGLGAGASPGLPGNGAGEAAKMTPQQLKQVAKVAKKVENRNEYEEEVETKANSAAPSAEEVDTKGKSAASAVKPAADPVKQPPPQAPEKREIHQEITAESKAVLQAAAAPTPSFEDALRGFRNALRTAHEDASDTKTASPVAKTNPSTSQEDHFIKKLTKLNAAITHEESDAESRKKDLTMQKMQVLNAMMSGH